VKAASGQASGPHAQPDLAEAAVGQALAAAGLKQAGTVLLFLSHDFTRHPQAAILAAARAAGCLQVIGCTASGLFTEQGWLLDQPAAAALVVESTLSARAGDLPLLSVSGHSTLPFAWRKDVPRVGLLDGSAAVWAHGRLSSTACIDAVLPGLSGRLALSAGLRPLAEAQIVEAGQAYDLQRVAGQSALDNLKRHLPAEWRAQPPLHQIAVQRRADEPAIPILAANGDGSLSLAEIVEAGEQIVWAIRQPLAAEEDMRQALAAVAPPSESYAPDFALMFSCIGRGPVFYGGEDRDLLAFRERFPDTPLLGAYGSGQIVPAAGQNHLFHNSVVTLLCESPHAV
jgi:small ligand-binding sensory domain FIST